MSPLLLRPPPPIIPSTLIVHTLQQRGSGRDLVCVCVHEHSRCEVGHCSSATNRRASQEGPHRGRLDASLNHALHLRLLLWPQWLLSRPEEEEDGGGRGGG